MAYLIGTDIGTSGTKTIVMDTEGKLLSVDLQEYDVMTPHALWAEQWPEVWLTAAAASIKNAVRKAGCPKSDIKGLCISGLYGGSGIPLDEQMNPVRPCLIWMDRRAEDQAAWVREHIDGERLRDTTHNGTDPYYGYTKILWIRDHEPENWARIRLFLPPNAYVIYKLTGEIAIDYSSAGNIGGIFNMNTRRWAYDLMDEMGIARTMMPDRIVESRDIVGYLTEAAASELELPAGIPVCAGGVDCVVATLGMGVFQPGAYVAAIGTSMCAALVHDKPIKSGGLIEMPYVKDATRLNYSFGGGATAGALIKWFRDEFAQLELQQQKQGGANAYAALDRQAEQVPPGSEGLIVLPYFMGERSPVWDTNARGTIVGLSLAHTRAHVYRAFLEAVAYSLRHTIESANEDVGDTIIVAGGVTKSPLWMQIIADVTGCKIRSPLQEVEANLGDILLAGVGTGCFTFEDATAWNTFGETVVPREAVHHKYNQYFSIYHSVYMHLREDMALLNQLGAI